MSRKNYNKIERDTFGKRLKKILDDHGVSQSELARALKIRPQTVNQWISDKNEPSLETIRVLCHLFEVNLVWLITGMESNQSRQNAELESTIKDGVGEYKIKFARLRPEDQKLVSELIDRLLDSWNESGKGQVVVHLKKHGKIFDVIKQHLWIVKKED